MTSNLHGFWCAFGLASRDFTWFPMFFPKFGVVIVGCSPVARLKVGGTGRHPMVLTGNAFAVISSRLWRHFQRQRRFATQKTNAFCGWSLALENCRKLLQIWKLSRGFFHLMPRSQKNWTWDHRMKISSRRGRPFCAWSWHVHWQNMSIQLLHEIS